MVEQILNHSNEQELRQEHRVYQNSGKTSDEVSLQTYQQIEEIAIQQQPPK